MKKLIALLLILLLCTAACGKMTEQSVCHDPGPPHVCRMGTAEHCRALLTAENDEIAIEILCAVGDDGGMLGEEAMKHVLEMIERAPIPMLEGAELYEIEVLPDDSWNQVRYRYNGEDAFGITYFLNKDQGAEKAEAAAFEKLEATMETATGRFYMGEVDGIKAEFQVIGKTAEEAEALIKELSFIRAEQLRMDPQMQEKIFGDTPAGGISAGSERLLRELVWAYEQEGAEEVNEAYYDYGDVYADMDPEEAQFCETIKIHLFSNGDILCVMENAMEYGLREDLNEKEVVMEFAERMKEQTGMDYAFDDCFYYWTLLFSEDMDTAMERYASSK